MDELETAAHEGRESFFRFRELLDNPYPVRTRKFYSWHDGFTTAKEDWTRRFNRTFVNPTT